MNHIPKDRLTLSKIPPPDSQWNAIQDFALTFDGYEYLGDECAILANETLKHFRQFGVLPPGLAVSDLRACLFFEQRRFRATDSEPNSDDMKFVAKLLIAIRESLPIQKESPVTDYKRIFDSVEETIYRIGSKSVPREAIEAELEPYKHYENQILSDNECFKRLVHIVFYAGMKAQIVADRLSAIDEYFGDYEKVSRYSESEISALMRNERIIRHKGKIRACVDNAKAFKKVVLQYGSFQAFIDQLPKPKTDFEILAVRAQFQSLFAYLGERVAFHFMMDMGLPVLKPDRVIERVFKRLRLVDPSLAGDALYLALIEQGKRFASVTGHPIRYVDIVFVAYGQEQTNELGLKEGICLENPHCARCGITRFCHYTN